LVLGGGLSYKRAAPKIKEMCADKYWILESTMPSRWLITANWFGPGPVQQNKKAGI
jgi:hypothetical protein